MSARESIKGYLYQTLIALLKMLEDDQWTTLSIEPKELDEKVDIFWSGETNKAIQVKSSKRQINKINAKSYIAELKDGYSNANSSYELVLCAHVTGDLKNGDVIDGATVRINNAHPIDMTQQAAQCLDTFLHRHGISQTPPLVRELLTRALISRLIDFSTDGNAITRADFEEQIKAWVLACYPEAARNARFSMCEVANGHCRMSLERLIDPRTGTHAEKEELQFISELYFVNASPEPSIIQYVVFSFTVDGGRHFCLPRFFFYPAKIDESIPPEKRRDDQQGLEIWGPICVPPKGVEHRKLVASSLNSEVSIDFLKEIRNSDIVIEVFVKYQHLDTHILAHAFDPNILFDELFDKKACIAYRLPCIEEDEDAIRQPIRRMQ
jgi:hypothetical protein